MQISACWMFDVSISTILLKQKQAHKAQAKHTSSAAVQIQSENLGLHLDV
jgi:hypothetical protein